MSTHTEPDWAALKTDIKSWGADMGFTDMGVTGVNTAHLAPALQQWLAQGYHGDMGYMERNLDKRLDPTQLEPYTARIISARMNYLPADTQPLNILDDARLGYVARYALGRDYHKVIRKRLAQLALKISAATEPWPAQSRAFTDSAPVLEKPLGAMAGLGWVGKHTLLLDAQAGSWFFLGEIYTNALLPIDAEPVADQCGNCRACMTVCPTNAIVAPGQLDARRCIAYLTIEHKGSIPVELRSAMGNRIFGCDDCQLYCPWNREAPTTTEPDFAPREQLAKRTLVDLFRWSKTEFLKHTEGSAIRRISYAQWQRNLAVALGNGPADADAIRLLEAHRQQSDQQTVEPSDAANVDNAEMVQQHVDWAIAQLRERQLKGKPA